MFRFVVDPENFTDRLRGHCTGRIVEDLVKHGTQIPRGGNAPKTHVATLYRILVRPWGTELEHRVHLIGYLGHGTCIFPPGHEPFPGFLSRPCKPRFQHEDADPRIDSPAHIATGWNRRRFPQELVCARHLPRVGCPLPLQRGRSVPWPRWRLFQLAFQPVWQTMVFRPVCPPAVCLGPVR